ncbi:MAG: cation transporter [Planctomycetes bacterium]|nr:cation transporter [Planctomycetota bacterium]
MAARPADRSHPFGHGKFEVLGAAVEGSFVLAAGIAIAYESIERLRRGEMPPEIPMYVCAVMAAASIFYYVISIYLMRIARETKSPAVLAEALHLRTHIYITGGLAAGLLAGAWGQKPVVDTFLAIGVAICLWFIAFHIFREVFSQFMDESLPEAEIDELAAMLRKFESQFVEVHGLRTRRSGVERHIEMHLVVLPETTVAAAHKLSHDMEDKITAKWPASRTTIHLEPLNTSHANYKEWIKGEPKVRTNDASPTDREFIH